MEKGQTGSVADETRLCDQERSEKDGNYGRRGVEWGGVGWVYQLASRLSIFIPAFLGQYMYAP